LALSGHNPKFDDIGDRHGRSLNSLALRRDKLIVRDDLSVVVHDQKLKSPR
jgi:hypothetical protein